MNVLLHTHHVCCTQYDHEPHSIEPGLALRGRLSPSGGRWICSARIGDNQCRSPGRKPLQLGLAPGCACRRSSRAAVRAHGGRTRSQTEAPRPSPSGTGWRPEFRRHATGRGSDRTTTPKTGSRTNACPDGRTSDVGHLRPGASRRTCTSLRAPESPLLASCGR
jgi:hypothetical protein